MPGMSDAAEADFLKLLFTNAAWANVGDATGLPGSATAGSFYVSLHTADPGDAGDQTTSEATYTGYARVPVARSTAGWTVSGTNPTQVVNAAPIDFPNCTAGSNAVTYFAVGRAVSGAGEIIVSGPLISPPSLAVSPGIAPGFAAGQLFCTLD